MTFYRYRRPAGHAAFILAALMAMGAPVAAQRAGLHLTEREAIERAIADPDLVAAMAATRDAARASVDAATLFGDPSVSVRHGDLSGPAGNEREWEADITQPIDLTGRRNSLRAAAVAEANSIEAETTRRLQLRVGAVRRAYADCAVALAAERATGALEAQLRSAERIIGARSEAGDSATYDLRRVRVEVRAAEAQSSLARGETEAGCALLSSLTGITRARADDPLSTPFLPAAPLWAAGRSDLLAQERRSRAAAFSARAAERARLPEFDLSLGYRRVETMGLSAEGPQISLGATIPLFGSSARVREARARERSAAAELALARRDADAEALAAFARLEAAIGAARAAEAAREDAMHLGTIAETAYQAGEIGVAELVDAYRAAHEAELSIVELTGRAIGAAIELDLAQGVIPQ